MRVRSAMLRHVLTACSLTVIVSPDILSSQQTTLALTTGDDPWSPVIGDTEGLPDVTLAPLNISSLSGRRGVNLVVENIRRQLMHDNYDYSVEDNEEHDHETNNTKPESKDVMQAAKVNMPVYAKTPLQIATTAPEINVDSSMQSQELLAKDLIYYVDETKLRRSNHNQSKSVNTSNTYKINKHIQDNSAIKIEMYNVSNPPIAIDDQKLSGRRQYQHRKVRKNHDVPSTTTFDGVYKGPMSKKPDKDGEIHDNSNYYANLIVPSTKRSRRYRRHKRRKQLHKMMSGLKRRAQKYLESDYESDASSNDEEDLPKNERWNNKLRNNYVIEELYRRSAHNKDLKPSNNDVEEHQNDFNDAQIIQQSTQDVGLRNDSGKLEQSTTSKVKYKLIKVKSRDGFRRKDGGQRQFLQERGPDGVSLIALDGGPFPQFRLPRGRRQYMFEDQDLRPPLMEQLPKSVIS